MEHSDAKAIRQNAQHPHSSFRQDLREGLDRLASESTAPRRQRTLTLTTVTTGRTGTWDREEIDDGERG